MTIRPTKIVRVAAGESPEAWRAALADPAWLASSTILKQQPGSWVRRATIMGRDVVIKCRELNTLARRFKAAIGMGHAAKHWRGAGRLDRAGVRTGTCRAIARLT